MRRPGPRRLDDALGQVVRDAAPATVLAEVQGVWKVAVGEVIATHAIPLAERAGTLTVTCDSSLWANEIDLSARDLVARLNAALGGPADGPLRALRARSGSIP